MASQAARVEAPGLMGMPHRLRPISRCGSGSGPVCSFSTCRSRVRPITNRSISKARLRSVGSGDAREASAMMAEMLNALYAAARSAEAATGGTPWISRAR